MPRVLAALALILALGLAGCGDDELSPSDYRAKAKAICQDSARETQKIEQPTRITAAALADYFRRQVAISERNVKRFDDLRPPKDLADRHDRLVRLGREGIDRVHAVVDAIDEGEDPRVVLTGAQKDLSRIGEEQKAAARALGVPECAGA